MTYAEGGKPSREDFAQIALFPRAALGADVIALHLCTPLLALERRAPSPCSVSGSHFPLELLDGPHAELR